MIRRQSWRATPSADYTGPRIALVHGLMAGDHMRRHLLQFVRDAGFEDATLYANHWPPRLIAKDLAVAAKAGRPIVLIGYSQGGSQIVKVANRLEKMGVQVNFAVSVAAGGHGRIHPAQWGFDMRTIPANVERYLNFYSPIDKLGSDSEPEKNLAVAKSSSTHLENICYAAEDGVDHIGIVRCFPEERVNPVVKELCLDRLIQELAAL